MLRHAWWTLAAAGCVAGGSNGRPDAGDPGLAFTPAQANVAGQALVAGIEEAARRYGPIAPAGFDAGCVTPSGDTSDPDGDTIPTSATLAYDCSERRLGYTGTLTGTEEVADGAPAALAWAFTATVDLRASLTGPFGGSLVVDTDGTVVASQAGPFGPFVLTGALDVISVITNVSGAQTDIAEDLDLAVSYAPDVQWTPGGPVLVGSLAADGAWIVSVDGRSASATLATVEPLRVTPSCETRVTAGRVEATFAAGAGQAVIAAQWSGCGDSVTYTPGAAGGT